MTAIIIDADPLVYRAGFAAEKYAYNCVVMEGGEMDSLVFAPKPKKTAGDQMKEFFAKNPQVELLDKEKIIEPESIDRALRGVKRTMKACIDDVCRLMQKTWPRWKKGPDDVVVLLTGKGNFREGIATIAEYKGNRDKAHRPYHYDNIREYLVRRGATVVNGYEADDECSIIAREYNERKIQHVVCTIDKDLDQIPGMHYDYSKKVLYEVTPDEARFMFWRQCLSGDGVDNIPGCFKIGVTKADKMLAKLLDNVPNEAYLWDAIVDIYAETMQKYPDKYPDNMTPAEAALETARLVKMQDYRGQLWTPPGLPDEVLE